MKVIAKVTLVDHDGGHPPGSPVEIADAKEAERLIRIGHAARAPVETAPAEAIEEEPVRAPRKRR